MESLPLHVSEGLELNNMTDPLLLFCKELHHHEKRTACPFGVVVLGHGGKYRMLDLAIVRQKTIEMGLKQCRISRVGYCGEA